MEQESASLSLKDRLRACAALWCDSTGRSLGALSTLVTNHGSFFERLGGERPSATTATLEKFAHFFADPASWPDGTVPAQVAEFVLIMLGAVEHDGVPVAGAREGGLSDHAAGVAQA